MKTAVMYGAGNIGRGFIAQLFCRSGYETVFIDVNESLVDALNEKGEYPLFIAENGEYRREIVAPVRAINGRNLQAVAQAIAGADIMATAVGVPILPALAEPIAAGIALRAEQKGAALNILVCENKIDANHYLADLVKAQLPAEAVPYFEENIGFVEPSIGRMVPAAPNELREKEPLAVCVEPYCELPVDKDSFCGDIPDIVNMEPVSPFGLIIRRKLFMHNMSHALTAYLGNLLGKTYIWEAIADPRIRFAVLSALGEAAKAISRTYQVEISPLLAHGFELLGRYDNALLGDTVARVGRDTGRKLGAEDRIMGAIRLCRETGVAVKWLYIAAAAGYRFAPEGDDSSAEMKAYAEQYGIARALREKSGLTDEEDIAKIADYYKMMKKCSGEAFLEHITSCQEEPQMEIPPQFQLLWNLAPEEWEKIEKRGLATSQGQLILTLSSQPPEIHVYYSDIAKPQDETDILAEYKKNPKKIEQILCIWQNQSVDLPSCSLRKALLEINPENLDAEILLEGLDRYHIRTLSDSLPN